MEMHQVRYFLAICETLNFTRASERCNISQPALTKAIQRLEETLGSRLFDRCKNNVTLTEFGRVMQPTMQELYETAQKAKAQAQALIADRTRRLKVGIMCTLGMRRLINFLAGFEKTHPNIIVSYEEGTIMQLHDNLDKDEIDLAIISTPYELPTRFSGTSLFDENFQIAFPGGHRFEKLDKIPMRDMDGENYVNRLNCEYSDLLTEMMDAQGVDVNVKHETPREDWIQEMVLAGMGVAYMPESMPLFGQLSARPVCEPEVVRTINVLTLAERTHTQEMTEFIKAATTYDWQASKKRQYEKVA